MNPEAIDFTQFNNVYSLLALAIVGIVVIIKWRYDYSREKTKEHREHERDNDMKIHIRKLSSIMDVVLKQYSSNINAEQMEKIYDWVFFLAYIKVLTLIEGLYKQFDNGLNLSNDDISLKLTQEVNNLYQVDIDDLGRFKYKNTGLDKFVLETGKTDVVTRVIKGVQKKTELEVLKNNLDSMFTAHKLRTVKWAKEMTIVN